MPETTSPAESMREMRQTHGSAREKTLTHKFKSLEHQQALIDAKRLVAAGAENTAPVVVPIKKPISNWQLFRRALWG